KEIPMRETCPHCGSDKIIPNVPLLDYYGETGAFSATGEVQVHGAPEAWVFKDTATGKVSLRICGGCGHAELQVSNFAELYEKYQKIRGKPGDAEALPPSPPAWTVCISEGQQVKTQMQTIQDLLLRERIPAGAAYAAAKQFRRGSQAVVPVRDAEAGQALVNALQGLGVAAELAESQEAQGTGPPG